MTKSKLNVSQNGNVTTIKKKPDASSCIIFALVILAGILLPVLYGELRDSSLFWIVLTACMLTNAAWFLSVFFGKIIVDADKRELNICNLCRETYGFDEVKTIKSCFQEGVDGGMDTHKILFTFKNGQKNELQTTSKEQTEELIELLTSMIFPQT